MFTHVLGYSLQTILIYASSMVNHVNLMMINISVTEDRKDIVITLVMIDHTVTADAYS